MWEGADPIASAPSPKLHAYEAMLPSESLEPVASKSTSSGTVPESGVAVNDAVGAVFAVTSIVCVAVAVAPSSSVTVRVAV